MRERGVRRGVWFERGKHDEGSGYAGGKNKGESGGGFVLGARRLGNWVDLGYKEVETHKIFVDGLPAIISKRELYKAFGRFGSISDIFVSRKTRQSGEGPFAFIRYNAYGEMKKHAKKKGKTMRAWPERRISQKWVEVKRTKEGEKQINNKSCKSSNELPQRKEIEAVWSEDQKQRLQRSLLGVCVKPIDLRKVMNLLLEEWKGPGEIEVRDVGPYRCLVTFSSPEIHDEAMESSLMK
ncbi:hypothetical protein PIB30_068609 [Stylosanthes scabra]|uniref:RRM domain-containing protein n=1 Tax=Stylosanthes scabra TaxID=79078 RepID=A0ABU6XL94_9FABA|nr:hypothetical protein [Stylosanthes scabra]